MKIPNHLQRSLLSSLFFGYCLMGLPVLSAQDAPPAAPAPAPSERGNPDQRMERVRRHVEKMHREGRTEEAQRMEMRMKNTKPHMMKHPMRDGKPMVGLTGPRGEARAHVAKIMHLKQAAMHLRAAGYEKQAEMAMEEIERTEKQIREEVEKRMKKAEKSAEEAKPDPAIEAEMKKMRREMEELRQQIRRMKEEREKREKQEKPKDRETPPTPAP